MTSIGGITEAGIGSKLDLESVIQENLKRLAVPSEKRLAVKEETIKTEISGVGSFKSALSKFEDVLKKLSSPDDFYKQSVTSSTADISVVTNGFASNGSFSVQVQQLAEGSQLKSTSTLGVSPFSSASDVVGTGVLTFGVGTDSFNVTIAGTDSLSSIRDKINEHADNFGVVANVLTTDAGTFLTYSSEVTGSANNLTVATSDSSLDAISTDLTEEQAAQDAIIFVDGNKVTKETNEFKNVIEDVTITASAVNMATPITLTIAQDTEHGANLIDEFISGYNSLANTMRNLSNAKTGELAFDPSIRQLKSQFSSIIGSAISGLSGSLDSLDDMGITLTKDGLLEVSSKNYGSFSGVSKRDDALENKLGEVGELLASDKGVVTKFSELIDTYNGSGGSLTKRQTSLNASLSDIKDEYIALQERVRLYEASLRTKFAFLDANIARYQNTGDWLTSALAPQKKD